MKTAINTTKTKKTPKHGLIANLRDYFHLLIDWRFWVSYLILFNRRRVSVFAASLSYRTLFALVPFVFLLLSFVPLVLSTLPDVLSVSEADIQAWLSESLSKYLVPETAERALGFVLSFTEQLRFLKWPSLILVLGSFLFLINSLLISFEAMWGCEKSYPFLKLIWAYFAALFALPAALVGINVLVSGIGKLSTVLSETFDINFLYNFFNTVLSILDNIINSIAGFFGFDSEVTSNLTSLTALSWLPDLIGYLAQWLLIALLLRYATIFRGKWSALFIAAFLAVVGLKLTNLSFKYVIMGSTGSIVKIYGALAFFPGLMLWMFLTWMVLLLAELFIYALDAGRNAPTYQMLPAASLGAIFAQKKQARIAKKAARKREKTIRK